MAFHLTQDTKDFLQQCRESGIMYLNSNRCVLTQTGGQLEYALHGDDEDVMFLDMTQDGTKIVTGKQNITHAQVVPWSRKFTCARRITVKQTDIKN